MPDKEEIKRKILEQRRMNPNLPYGEYRNSISFEKMPPEVQEKYRLAMEQAKKKKEN